MTFWHGLILGMLAATVLGLSHRLQEITLLLGQYEQRLQAVERVAEDASAGVDQLAEDLADLSRRALALDPQYVQGDEEAPD